MKKKLLIVLSLTAVVFYTAGCNSKGSDEDTGAGSAAQTLEYKTEPEVHELIVSSQYQTIGDESELCFETAITDEEKAAGTEVALYDPENNKIAVLCDDGTNGDKEAGDNIYACRYKPVSDTAASFSYTVKIGKIETNPVKITFFDEITDEDFDTLHDVTDMFEQLTAEFKNDDGFIPAENVHAAMEKVAQKAEEMMRNDEVVDYRVNEQFRNVVIKLRSGITYIYKCPEEGVDSLK